MNRSTVIRLAAAGIVVAGWGVALAPAHALDLCQQASGQVLAVSGPVAGATVTAADSCPGNIATTDATGHYTVDVPWFAEATPATASATGYAAMNRPVSPGGPTPANDFLLLR